MIEKIANGSVKIAVVGLGYVGLPLAVEFGKKFETVGFDLDIERLKMLQRGIDSTLETTSEDLNSAKKLRYSSNPNDLAQCDFFIVTVPTPVNEHKQPDLSILRSASASIGKIMKRGSVVIYESTVFPGCTEEQCVPVLETSSGMKFNEDFFCGYSPERINPGDKEHTLVKIKKITSGSTAETADAVDALYNAILLAGTYKASSMKVAEAAKAIENSQRDLNIAFVNELAKFFNMLGIDSGEVLEAAGTKWNFLNFKPGLVGGHCIGVDPYYLAYKSQEIGYFPEIMLAGRRVNDGMGKYIVSEVLKLMIKKSIPINAARVLVLGITFKENCPDIRNSKAVDIIRGMEEFGSIVDVYDPRADATKVMEEYGVTLLLDSELKLSNYCAIILTTAHDEFKTLDFSAVERTKTVVYDVRKFLPKELVDASL